MPHHDNGDLLIGNLFSKGYVQPPSIVYGFIPYISSINYLYYKLHFSISFYYFTTKGE